MASAAATHSRSAEPKPAARSAPRPVPDVLAAVDLGSNSFHMVVARYSHGQLVIIDRLREMVRLAAGVAENGRIDKDVAARALACLERFGQRLRDMHADSVRCVGTNALRLAHRKQAFLERAREALGHPIEIIAGMEEARLIYAGVAHTMPSEPGKRLVVDIGGGSTELIIGDGLTPLELESLQMGCVSLSERFFRDGKISAKRIERARLAARMELEPVEAAFRRRGWEHSAGSSGTVRAIGDAIRALDPQARHASRPQGLQRAIDYCVEAGHTRELNLEPITEDRRPVFPGGTGDPRRGVQHARGQGDADRRRGDARGPAVRHARPLQARGCARAHRARHAAALPRRHRAGRARRGHGARLSSSRRATPGSSRSRSRTWR